MAKKETKPAGLGKKAVAAVKKSGKKPIAKIELKSKPVAPTKAYKETAEPVVLKGEAAEAVLNSKHEQFTAIGAIEVTGVSENAVALASKAAKAAKAAKPKLPTKPASGALARATAAIKAAAKSMPAEDESSSAASKMEKPATDVKKSVDDGTLLQTVGRRPMAAKAAAPQKAAAGKMSFADLKAQAAGTSSVGAATGFDVSKYLRK